MDACTLDFGPLLRLLRCRRLRLLLPRLPQRGGVVLSPAGLEESKQPAHPVCSAAKGPQKTGERNTSVREHVARDARALQGLNVTPALLALIEPRTGRQSGLNGMCSNCYWIRLADAPRGFEHSFPAPCPVGEGYHLTVKMYGKNITDFGWPFNVASIWL